MKHYMVITVGLIFAALHSSAEEQILFVSDRHGNDEIYRHFPGIRTQRLTFAAGLDSDPALSPDGTKMAYVSSPNRTFQITVLDFKSGKHEQLTFSLSPKRNFSPSWSPDGDRIAFASDRDGDMDIYIMDANGRDVSNLTDDSLWNDSSPHWSPVSNNIVFISYCGTEWDEVYLLDVQTGIQRKLTSSSYFAAHPRWSPNGSQIAYLSTHVPLPAFVQPNTAIWRVKSDGSDLEKIVTQGETNTHPKYSPNGEWVAFESYIDSNSDIYTLNINTQELIRLTTHHGYDSYPDWSPDGERIAFVSGRDGNLDIFTMTVNREQLTNLTMNGFSEHHPTWSPDGERIVFSRRMGDTSTRIFVIDSDGENEVELVDLPISNTFPTWSPRGDKLAFVNRPEPGEPKSRIYTIDFDGQNLDVIYEDLDNRIGEMDWSADGTQIIINQIRGPISFLDLATQEVQTINVQVSNLYTLDWSPNGQDIIFSAPIPVEVGEPRHGIFIIDRDGTPLRTIYMDTPPFTRADGLTWSPDGNKMLFGHDGKLFMLDLESEAAELYMETGGNPDWQDPTRPRPVSPRNKLNTTWGELKKGERR